MTSFIWRLPVCLGQPHTYLPCLLCTSVSDLTASITTTASAILQRLNLSKVSAACHVDPALCDNRSLTHYHLFEERPGTCRRSSGSRTRPCAVHPGGPSEAGVGEVLSTASLRHPTTCSGACTSRSPSPWASSPVQSSPVQHLSHLTHFRPRVGSGAPSPPAATNAALPRSDRLLPTTASADWQATPELKSTSCRLIPQPHLPRRRASRHSFPALASPVAKHGASA